jgi:hypothetical protein
MDNDGFSEMSGMMQEITELVSNYPSKYDVNYKFK